MYLSYIPYLFIIFIMKCYSLPVDESELISINERIPNKKTSDVISFEMKKPVDPFIGRVEQLNELSTQNGPIVITGVAGIGKTELIRKHINDHIQRHPSTSTIWIDSTSYDTLIFSFNQLASYIGIDTSNKTPSEIITEIFLWFINKPVIFIFDNGSTDNYVLNNLDKFVTGRPVDLKFIITSRNVNWNHNKFKIIKLDVFSKEEAVEFIEKNIVVPDNKDDIIKLVDILKYIPLALSKSVRYINNKNDSGTYTINDFISEFIQIESDRRDTTSDDIPVTSINIPPLESPVREPEPNIMIITQTSVRPPTRDEITGVITHKLEKEFKRNVKKVRNFFRRLRSDVGL